jgi:hypothetical protein
MKSFNIRYQTSELVPAPFANAVEIKAEIDNKNQIKYSFELTYIDRNQLTEDEILEEGFSLDDDIKLAGTLNANWTAAYETLLTDTHKTYIKELKDDQDFWEIEIENEVFYPRKPKTWKTFIEEFQQAVYEQNKLEKPLEITILRPESDTDKQIIVKGSFENRSLIVEKKGLITRDWKELNVFLKNVFVGDFDYENSLEKAPARAGIFVNLGDEYWFEVGKSLIIQPSKITGWVDSF